MLNRVGIQNCHGCHTGNVSIGGGITFPVGYFGAHVDEQLQLQEDGVQRFLYSQAVRRTFAPNRVRILTDFLLGKPLPVHSNGGTIGGGRTSD